MMPDGDTKTRANSLYDRDFFTWTQEQARLQYCIDGLADHERAALRGAFFDGNTYEELAERMKVPLGTMKSRIRRAMIKLKACLEQ